MNVYIQDHGVYGCIFVIAYTEAGARTWMEMDYPELYEKDKQVQIHSATMGFTWANYGDR